MHQDFSETHRETLYFPCLSLTRVQPDSDYKSKCNVLLIWSWCIAVELLKKWQHLCRQMLLLQTIRKVMGLVHILLILLGEIFLLCFSLYLKNQCQKLREEMEEVSIYPIISQIYTYWASVKGVMVFFLHYKSMLSPFIWERKHINKCTRAQHPDVSLLGFAASYNNLQAG